MISIPQLPLPSWDSDPVLWETLGKHYRFFCQVFPRTAPSVRASQSLQPAAAAGASFFWINLFPIFALAGRLTFESKVLWVFKDSFLVPGRKGLGSYRYDKVNGNAGSNQAVVDYMWRLLKRDHCCDSSDASERNPAPPHAGTPNKNPKQQQCS